jgi:hypothetical protein
MTAVNFPDSPTDGQIFEIPGRSWRWVASAEVWEAVAGDRLPPVEHSESHESGGSDEISIVSGMIANGTITNDDISSSAAIATSKLASNSITLNGEAVSLGSSTVVAPSGNAIINGGFDIWQRGTSFSNPVGGALTADRWKYDRNGSGGTYTISQQNFSPGELNVLGFGEPKQYLRVNFSQAPTGQTFHNILHRVEDVQTFAGQTVTLSYWARSSTEMVPYATPSIAQLFGTGGSSSTNTAGTPLPEGQYTTSWTRYTHTLTLPTVTGKTIGSNSCIDVRIRLQLNAAINFDIWGVQLEAGSVATPFKRNANSVAGELTACQRYYQTGYFDVRLSAVASQNYSFSATAISMRATPTAAFTAVAEYSNNISGTPVVFVPSNTPPTVSLRFVATGNGDLFYGRPYELAAEL